MNQQNNGFSFNVAILGVVISWLSFGVFLLAPFGFLVWLGILVYLISKNTFSIFYVILSAWLLVPSLSFLGGIYGYVTQTGVVKEMGGERIERFQRIDEITRLPIQSSGCVFVGFELFIFPPNNGALALCTTLFGFQKGTYQGEQPSVDKAFQLIAKADTLSAILENDFYKVKIANKYVKVPHIQMEDTIISLITIRGTLLGQKGFLFQHIRKSSESNVSEKLYLLDIEHQTIINAYERMK